MSTQTDLPYGESTLLHVSLRKYFREWTQRFDSIPNTALLSATLSGMAIGVCFVLVLLPYVGQYGTSFIVQSALLASFLIAASSGFVIRNSMVVKSTTPWFSTGVYLALLTWLICLPMINAAANSIWYTQKLTVTDLQVAVLHSINWFDLICLVLHGSCLLLPPMLYWILYPIIAWDRSEQPDTNSWYQSQTNHTFWLGLGVLAGFFLSVNILAQWIGLTSLSWLLTGCCLLKLLITCTSHFGNSDHLAADKSEQIEPAEFVNAQTAKSQTVNWLSGISLLLLHSGCGVLCFSLMQISQQLIPVMTYTLLGQVAAVMAGVLIGLNIIRRYSDRLNQCLGWVTLLVTAHAILVVGLFPQWVHSMLFITSGVQSVSLLLMLRTMTLMVLLLPLGILSGCVVGAGMRPSPRDLISQLSVPILLFGFFAGWLVTAMWLLPALGMTVTISSLAALLLIIALQLSTGVFRRWQAIWRQKLILRGLAAFCLIVICSSPWLANNYQPALAARLLFGTNVFDAYRNGVEYRSLSSMDEGRLLETRIGTQGPLSIWRYRGSQIQIRENGYPKGIVSLDDRICPQYSAEVVTTLLPMLLHERVEEVLILGLGSGLNVSTCLEYPIHKLTCVESNSTLIKLIDEQLWQQKRDSVNKVGWKVTEPALAIQKNCGQYDLVLSFPDSPALAQSLPYFSHDFYTRAARSLKTDGIFCQRFSYVDFGPEPLQDVVATLQSAFANVMLIETAPGELALLGTNCQAGLESHVASHAANQSLSNPLVVDDIHEGFLRDGFLKRLQSPKSRKILAKLSWDWSMILNCSAFDNAALKDFTQQSNRIPLSVASGRNAFEWPRELMRWAPKWQEIQAQLVVDANGNNRSSRLLAWLPAIANDQVVLQRLADVVGKSHLIVEYPDHPKAYRKSLRQHLSKQPRSRIKHVNGEVKRVLHEEEQRRKEYFQDLARAVKQPHPTLEQIQNLELYAEPFDPILSYFLHYEIADLYQKLQPPDYRAAYLHRMHAIFYSDQQDRSVRNVAQAIQILIEHPDAVAEETQRYDHLNALLQVLKSRWELRKSDNPKHAGTAFNDVQKSLSAAESAIEAMQTAVLADMVNHPDWPSRREYLNRVLVRPLRAYRGKLKSHASKQNQDTKALLNYLKKQQSQN